MVTSKYNQSVIQHAYRVSANKYSTPEQRDMAINILVANRLLTNAVRKEGERARYLRWADQCECVISQKEREHSAAWFQLRLDRGTDKELQEWMVGKTIGLVCNGVVIVTLGEQTIPVMRREEAEVRSFASLDGKFTLAYEAESQSMVIRQFESSIKSRRRSGA